MKNFRINLAVLSVVLCGILEANPNDPQTNPLRNVVKVYAPPPGEGGAEVSVLLDGPIDAQPSVRLPNYSVRQLSLRLERYQIPVVMEDLDKDGDMDLVTLEYLLGTGTIFAYKNVGSPTKPRYDKEKHVLATVNTSQSSIAFINLDNDQDREIVCSDQWGGIHVMFRSGPDSSWPIQGNYGPTAELLQQSEAGVTMPIKVWDGQWWTPGAGTPMITFCDIDNDGLQDDMLVGKTVTTGSEHFGSIWAYRGTGLFDGNGAPVFATPIALEADGAPIVISGGDREVPNPVMHDVDGDGDLDLLISDLAGGIVVYEAAGKNEDVASASDGFTLFTKRGALTGQAGVALSLGKISSLQVADFSEDGDLDLIVVSSDSLDSGEYYGSGEYYLRVVENHNASPSIFSDYAKLIGIEGHEEVLKSRWRSGAVFFDFDGDGKIDILQVGENSLSISYNLDTGNRFKPQFSRPIKLPLSDVLESALDDGQNNYGYTADIADFDGDGFPDEGVDGIVLNAKGPTYEKSIDILFIKFLGTSSEGLPQFADPVSLLSSPLPANSGMYPSVGDVNNDGFLDVVLAGNKVQVLANSVSNGFSLSSPVDLLVGDVPWQASFVDVADVNSDGYSDILSLRYSEIEILEGVSGTFVNTGYPRWGPNIENTYMSTPRLVNFDSDDGGRLDLLLLTDYSTIVPYLSSNVRESPEISLLAPGPPLKMTATLPEYVQLSGSGSNLTLQFPVLPSVGGEVHFNELRISGQRCSITGVSLADYREDLDSDGMADGWEAVQRGLGGGGAEQLDPSGDGDVDGLTNVNEFQQRTNPRYPDHPAVKLRFTISAP